MKKSLALLIALATCSALLSLFTWTSKSHAQQATVIRYVGDVAAHKRWVSNGTPYATIHYSITQSNPGLIVYATTQFGTYSNSMSLLITLDATGYGEASYYSKAVAAGDTTETICSPEIGCASDSPTYYTVLTPASGVAKLQYLSDGVATDIAGTLYVLQGTTVTFKAIPSPSGSVFFSYDPSWSGTSGVTGSGETTSVTFNTLSKGTKDYKTVTATVGNGGGSNTANVVVYSLTGTLTPKDNFRYRSTTRYGIGETIDLSSTITPAITATQAGGLIWRVTGGTGKLSDSRSDGINTYTAPNVAESATLKLEVLSGPSKGLGPSFTKDIVTPSGATEQRAARTSLIHQQYTCSVGFYGIVYLLPKDVSFSNIGFQEDTTLPSIATGYYSFLSQEAHMANGPYNITGCNTTTGCQTFTNPNDKVYTGDGPPPYSVGEFLWPIPWMYVVVQNGQVVATQFTVGNHHQLSDAVGKATIEKAGSGQFSANASDPTIP